MRAPGPDAGPNVSVAGNTYRTVVSGKETGGAYAIISMMVPPGGGPAPHAHATMHEAYYVIAGEVVFRSETQTYTAKAGAVVDIPTGGAVHNFTNESGDVAHLLCVVVPAGLEEMFAEVGKPVEPGTFLPRPAPPGPEELARLQGLARKYGQEMFPPNYLDK